MQHIIKKQVINLSVDKKQDAFHIQHLVSSYYRNKIVPLLEEAFDAASNVDETIRIDTLEIDLGIINIKEIEKGIWKEKVFNAISEKLMAVKFGSSSEENVKKKSRELSISEQWIFYMRHGYLPWNVMQINQDWYDNVLQAFASDAAAISDLRNLIRNYPASVKRIVYQHSEKFLKSLIETLTAENQDELPGLINELSQALHISVNGKQNSVQQEEWKCKLWADAITICASASSKWKSEEIVRLLLPENSSENENKEPDKLFEGKPDIDEEGIYVENAGVVLLHPFLNQFFRMLDLLKDGVFKDLFHHQKALYLLHFLASGNAHPLEHELTVAKVLCEFPLKEPVTNLIKLNEAEIAESNELLKEVIQQWSILKNTSVDGLREGFLRRKGKLFTRNNTMHLQVEQSSIDMLLDHLPWNLSIIKLPWMHNVLKVEWR